MEKLVLDAPISDPEVELARVLGRVPSPAAPVWALLMDFGRPERLAASIERCECVGIGEGAIRRVYARGLVIHEQLMEADPETMVFRYAVLSSGDMPLEGLKTYKARVQLRSVGSDATEIDWSSRGIVAGSLAPIKTALTTLYSGAIENIGSILRDA